MKPTLFTKTAIDEAKRNDNDMQLRNVATPKVRLDGIVYRIRVLDDDFENVACTSRSSRRIYRGNCIT